MNIKPVKLTDPAWNHGQVTLTFPNFQPQVMIDTGSNQLMIPQCSNCYAQSIQSSWPTGLGQLESQQKVELTYTSGTVAGHYYQTPLQFDSQKMRLPVFVTSQQSLMPGIWGLSMYSDHHVSFLNKILNRLNGHFGYTLDLINMQLLLGQIIRQGGILPLKHHGQYMLVECQRMEFANQLIHPPPQYIIFDTGMPDLMLSTRELNRWKSQLTKPLAHSQPTIKFWFDHQTFLKSVVTNPTTQLETDDALDELATQLKLSSIVVVGWNFLLGHQLSYDFNKNLLYLI